jgi:hypothetical protein
MKIVFLVAAGAATIVCIEAAAVVALGFGTPNVGDGTLTQFWATLWGTTFVATIGGIMLPALIGYVWNRATG